METRKILKEAFISLMEEKGFEKITIRDLTTSAKLNRGTFYLHYKDKYDLMEQLQAEIIDDVQEIMAQINMIDGIMFHLNQQPYPPIIEFFKYLEKHYRKIKALLSTNGDPIFRNKLKNIFKHIVVEKAFSNSNPMLQEYIPAFASSAFLGLIEHWLEQDMPQPPEEMANFFINLVKFVRPQVTKGFRE